jgi:hypothetical protein
MRIVLLLLAVTVAGFCRYYEITTPCSRKSANTSFRLAIETAERIYKPTDLNTLVLNHLPLGTTPAAAIETLQDACMFIVDPIDISSSQMDSILKIVAVRSFPRFFMPFMHQKIHIVLRFKNGGLSDVQANVFAYGP